MYPKEMELDMPPCWKLRMPPEQQCHVGSCTGSPWWKLRMPQSSSATWDPAHLTMVETAHAPRAAMSRGIPLDMYIVGLRIFRGGSEP